MEFMKTIAYAAIKRAIDYIRNAVEKNIRPTILIHQWLDQNRWVMQQLVTLPDDAKKELINLLSDTTFREWIYTNIDDILNYIIQVIKATMIQIPQPGEKSGGEGGEEKKS